jgi:hypothetical protein
VLYEYVATPEISVNDATWKVVAGRQEIGKALSQTGVSTAE